MARVSAPSLTSPPLTSSQPTQAPGLPWALNIRDREWAGGAVGNGVHDDTAAVQAAINGANAVGGGIVSLPRGTYLISSALMVYSHVRLIGDTRGTTIIKAANGNFTNGLSTRLALVKWNGGDEWSHGVTMEDIRFDTSSVAGLGGMWFQRPGEESWFNRLRCDSCAASAVRTVTDAQITSGSNVVTFTASTFGEDDVNSLITDRTDGDYTLAGPTIPAYTKIDKINYANPTALPPQRTATSITLSANATASAANSNFKSYQPTPPFMFEGGGAATGRIGALQGSNNTGTLLRISGPVVTAPNQSTAGTWSIDSLSGDGNGGGVLRASRQACGEDPMSIAVGQIKVEPGSGGQNVNDPVILFDRCGTVNFTLYGGSVIASASGTPRTVVRIDQKQAGGGPSITLHGGEGANPFNNAYTNIIQDTDTGEVIVSGPASGSLTTNNGVVTGQRYYPMIVWGRDVLLGGGAKVPKYQTKRRYCPMWATPDVLYNTSSWTRIYQSGSLGTYQTYNATNAQNDGAAWQMDLSAGVWKMTLAYQKNTNNAIATIDFSQDGGNTWTSIGTLDEYAASATNANIGDFTNITVPYDGTALVRFQALTRNASNTTGWTLVFSGMEWSRTA